MNVPVETLRSEEQIITELEGLGVRYLSRLEESGDIKARAPHDLLAELVRQPSSRVRAALIALLLARPDYAAHVPAALAHLTPEQAQIFKFFYTAAVCLQRLYGRNLKIYLGARWLELPDTFSAELGVRGPTPAARLRALAHLHARQTGVQLNWAGTYENAAQHLLRRWEMERLWNR